MWKGKKRNEKKIWNDHETLMLVPIPNYFVHFDPSLFSFIFLICFCILYFGFF
jgi:hypothetical protein